MAWFELHQELCAHPKTKRLAKALGICLPQAVGHCVCLWTWAMSYAQDGDLTDHGEDGIADAAQWPGDARQFVNAMIECGIGDKPGFLEWVDGDVVNALVIHDWEDYAGKYIEKRDREKLRQRERRSQVKPAVRTTDVHSTLPQHTADVAEQIREDKIREDKSTEDSESAPVGAAPTPEPAPGPVVEPAPEPEPKPKKARAVQEGGQADMFGAITETCQLDAKLKTGQIAKTAKALLSAGYTPAQVRAFPVWWQIHDWRGQRGDTPTIAQLTEKIKQSVNGVSPPVVTPQRNGQWATLGERQSADYKLKMAALLGD